MNPRPLSLESNYRIMKFRVGRDLEALHSNTFILQIGRMRPRQIKQLS